MKKELLIVSVSSMRWKSAIGMWKGTFEVGMRGLASRREVCLKRKKGKGVFVYLCFCSPALLDVVVVSHALVPT